MKSASNWQNVSRETVETEICKLADQFVTTACTMRFAPDDFRRIRQVCEVGEYARMQVYGIEVRADSRLAPGIVALADKDGKVLGIMKVEL